MARSVRQKRKGRSSRPTVRQNASRKRPVNPTGNALIAQNWDKKQTLVQNYRRLGLMGRLALPTGGIEKAGSAAKSTLATSDSATTKPQKGGVLSDPFSIDAFGRRTAVAAANKVHEVLVERDAEGHIVRVVGDGASSGRENPRDRPLDDPLSDTDEEEDEGAGAEQAATATAMTMPPVVAALEQLARQRVGPRRQRHQSETERAWLQRLADHYRTADPDDDTLAAMARDRRHNPMQRTAGDLRRRLAAFRAAGGQAE